RVAPAIWVRAAAKSRVARRAPSRLVHSLRRTESAIARGQIRRATEERLMTIKCRRPQVDVGRPPRVHLVRSNDLMFGFLNSYQLAKLIRGRDLAFADRLGMRLEEAQDLLGYVGVPTENPRTRLREHPFNQRPHVPQLVLRAPQLWLNLWGRRPDA